MSQSRTRIEPAIDMVGSLWEGDARWQVNKSGQLEPCSLKQIVLSYISENLGSVCYISPHDTKTSVCYEKLSNKINGTCRTDTEDLEKSDCDNNASVLTVENNNGVSETTDNLAEASVSDVETYREPSAQLNADIQKVIPYNLFNVPNNGRAYEKSDSIDPPGEAVRTEIIKHHNFNFGFR